MDVEEIIKKIKKFKPQKYKSNQEYFLKKIKEEIDS